MGHLYPTLPCYNLTYCVSYLNCSTITYLPCFIFGWFNHYSDTALFFAPKADISWYTVVIALLQLSYIVMVLWWYCSRLMLHFGSRISILLWWTGGCSFIMFYHHTCYDNIIMICLFPVTILYRSPYHDFVISYVWDISIDSYSTSYT